MSNEYQYLAGEYYDEKAHPTIALLRAGSRLALEALAPELLGAGASFAEVGSGRGMLNTVATPEHKVVNFDLNTEMLRHATGVGIIADARSLPVLEDVFDGVFASLCDPYNTPAFLAESRRVLKPGGRLLMTVPNHTWVRHNQDKEGVVDAAVVVSKEGPVIVPSYVHAPEEQVATLGASGFLHVKVHQITLAAASAASGVESARLLDQSGQPISAYVTDAYLAW